MTLLFSTFTHVNTGLPFFITLKSIWLSLYSLAILQSLQFFNSHSLPGGILTYKSLMEVALESPLSTFAHMTEKSRNDSVIITVETIISIKVVPNNLFFFRRFSLTILQLCFAMQKDSTDCSQKSRVVYPGLKKYYANNFLQYLYQPFPISSHK